MIIPQLILSDIDGTLLNNQHKLLSSVKNAIQHYVQKGGLFCLASARPAKAMFVLASQMNLKVPLATLNGAYIIKSDQNKTILFEQPLLNKSTMKIIQIVKQNHLKISLNLYAGEDWFIEHPNYWSSQEAKITQIKPSLIDFNSIYNQKKIHKILCMGQPQIIKQLSNLLAGRTQLKITASHSKPTYLEITDQNVSKLAALKHLAAYFSVPLNKTMALGDGDNDLAMIKKAGIGIALANASPALLANANFIVPSNNDGGVAFALEKYVQNK